MFTALRGWIISFALWIIAFSYFELQYSPAQRLTIFFINKAVANTALFLIGLSFLYGPLCKMLPQLARHIYVRRYLGVLGFFTALFHLLLSLLQFTGRFPFAWYMDHIVGVIAAIIATIIFSVLAVTSTSKWIGKLGANRWKTIQRTGYIALVFVLLHIYMASGSRWELWLRGEVSMPNSFAMFAFGIVVLIVRLVALTIDTIHRKKNPPQAMPSQ